MCVASRLGVDEGACLDDDESREREQGHGGGDAGFPAGRDGDARSARGYRDWAPARRRSPAPLREECRHGETRLGPLGGARRCAFAVLYIVAFTTTGIDFDDTDRAVLAHYASSSARAKEVAAFFLIAAAALSLVVFGNGLRTAISRATDRSDPLAALAWAGTTGCAALILAGNALSRATALAAMDDKFVLNPSTRKLFENAGYLLFVSGALAAILLVAAVAIAVFRLRTLSRWVGWVSIVAALLLPLAIVFIGFLVFLVWVLTVSVSLWSHGRAKKATAVTV